MEENPPAAKIVKLVKLACAVAFVTLVIFGITSLEFKKHRWGFMEFLGPGIGVVIGFFLDIAFAGLALASILSMPVTLVGGIYGMISSIKFGKVILLYGLIATTISAVNIFLWIKYGGLPL